MSNVIPLHAGIEMTDVVTDESLVVACGNGDMSALGKLFSRYKQDLYRFLSRISGTDDAELDDLVQNTFLQVRKSAGRFKGKSSVRSWIFAIGVNIAKNYVRSSARRKAAYHAFGATASRAMDGRIIDDDIERKQMLNALSLAIGELSFKLRVVFIMCDVEGVPGAEAAQTLGIRKGTLWRRLHDARKKLAKSVERRASK
jgi:RNA polymerase sigma-70 factor (ECF subfamily)